MTVVRDLVRRFDRTVAYVRSFFDEPTRPGKASAVRLCAIAMCAGTLYTVHATVRFAFAHPAETAMARLLAGLVFTLGVTALLKLLARTKGNDTASTDPNAPAATAPGAETETPA